MTLTGCTHLIAIGVPPILLAMSGLRTYSPEDGGRVAVDLPEQVIDSG